MNNVFLVNGGKDITEEEIAKINICIAELGLQCTNYNNVKEAFIVEETMAKIKSDDYYTNLCDECVSNLSEYVSEDILNYDELFESVDLIIDERLNYCKQCDIKIYRL